MGSEMISAAAFVVLLAMSVAISIIAVKREGRGLGDILKQLIIGVGIAALLPLSSWAGATLIHPRTHLKELMSQEKRVSRDTYDSNQDVAARTKARDDEQQLTKQIDEESRLFY